MSSNRWIRGGGRPNRAVRVLDRGTAALCGQRVRGFGRLGR
jgi:hypothetical protein